MEIFLEGIKVIIFCLGMFLGAFIGKRILIWRDSVAHRSDSQDLLLIRERCRALWKKRDYKE